MISNCVINLAADKPAVFREIARVLKPGGRMGITDIVAEDRLTADERAERGSYTGCIAGALSFSEFRTGLEAVGLSDVTLTPTHDVADGMVSVIVQAPKPADARPLIDLSQRSELPIASCRLLRGRRLLLMALETADVSAAEEGLRPRLVHPRPRVLVRRAGRGQLGHRNRPEQAGGRRACRR